MEKPGNVGVVSASYGPTLTIDDRVSPSGPLCTQVMRSLVSMTKTVPVNLAVAI